MYEVQFSCMNPGKPHQLRYVYSVGWIGWDVAVHMGEIGYLKVEVIPLVVGTDMITKGVPPSSCLILVSR